MKFEDSFIIWYTREEKITLVEALKVAKREGVSDLVYDPLGIGNAESWWWCVAVLEVLQQEDFIREFDIVKPAPEDQQVESEEGVVY